MPSNSAQQTAQAQQGQQNQAEQFLAQQRQLAEQQWGNFFSQNPNPASTWGRIQGPGFSGMPSTLGGGTIGGPSGGTLQGALGGMQPGGGSFMTPGGAKTGPELMGMIQAKGLGGGGGRPGDLPKRPM